MVFDLSLEADYLAGMSVKLSNPTLIMDPQVLSGKEKSALVSSASLGPQLLSTRLVLAGIPPLCLARDKSATTVILPSVEHTEERPS